MRISRYAVKTDQGPVLGNNEDGHLVDLELNLFCIFDGFGGIGIGDKAVEEVKKDVSHFLRHFGGDPNSTMPFYYGQRFLIETNALINSLIHAHKNLLKKNIERPVSHRSGVCFGGVIFSDNLMTFVGVGNLRGYYIRQGAIHNILRDDSLNEALKNIDFSTMGKIPASAIGLFEDFQYSVKEVRFQKGDSFLLVSDGVYSNLSDKDILQVLFPSTGPFMPKIDNLFGQANARGNQDNQTALLIEV